jgi:hypothetical protein
MSNSTTTSPLSQSHHEHHGPPTHRHEVDFQCPVEFHITHTYIFKLDPDLIELLADITNPEPFPMTEQELKDYADAKTKEIVDALTATVTAEHDEVMAAIAAGGGTQGLTDDQIKAAIDSSTTGVKDQLTTLIQGVFDAATTPTPTPPTPTPPTGPTPAPGPAPTPTPPAGGEGQPVPSSVAP